MRACAVIAILFAVAGGAAPRAGSSITGGAEWEHVPWRARGEGAARVVLARVPAGGIQPEVVRDDAGTLHMVYFGGEARAGDLFYVRSLGSGASFTEPLRVNSQPGSALATGTVRSAQIALGGGRVHVAWPGSAAALPRGPEHPRLGQTTAPMLYARSDPAGTRFEPQRNLAQITYGLDGGSIAADAAGNVYVAWHGLVPGTPEDEDHRAVRMARSIDAGETFAPEQVLWSEPTGACGCCGLRLLVSPAGGLYALYRSATDLVHRDLYLLLSMDAGRTFRGNRVDEWELAACPMSTMAMTATADRVLAAWETAGQVYFGPVVAGSADISQVMAAPDSGINRKHPRLAINDRGELLLAWTEGTAWERGGDLAWQLYDADLRPLGEMGRQAGVPVWGFTTPAARADGSFVIFY